MYIRDAFITISFSSMGNRSICKLETQIVGNWTCRMRSSRSSSGEFKTNLCYKNYVLREKDKDRDRNEEIQRLGEIHRERTDYHHQHLLSSTFLTPKNIQTLYSQACLSQGPFFMLSYCPNFHILRVTSVPHRSVMNLLF